MFGSIFLFFSGIFLIANVPIQTLNCHRLNQGQISCKLIYSSLISQKTQLITAEEGLQGAELKRYQGSKGTNYSVTIVTRERKIYSAMNESLDRTGNGKNVEAINNFVKDQDQKSLTVVYDIRLVAYLLGSFITLISSLIFFNEVSYLIWPGLVCFDKKLGKLLIKKSKTTGWLAREYNLSEIRGVKTVDFIGAGGKSDNCKMNLCLKSGQEITLFTFNYTNIKKTQKTVEIINRFLGNTVKH